MLDAGTGRGRLPAAVRQRFGGMQAVTAAQVADKAAEGHSGQVDQVSGGDADLKGDPVKDDLLIGIIRLM